ncbi:MAG: TldD/PmbA family protein, partial [Candidatus Sumerlaeia bacterium]|nr:TldD/PmbA family protein [Candidatus Sumerlaeia bacterium]
ATGHGLPVPSGEGAHAAHLVMEGGAATLPALIASTDRGVLITRAWYTNFVDFKRALITGMTRDGTFLIEDGKVTRALRDLRFNVSLFELLGRIEALGPQGRHAGVVAPAMRVRGFRFTS